MSTTPSKKRAPGALALTAAAASSTDKKRAREEEKRDPIVQSTPPAVPANRSSVFTPLAEPNKAGYKVTWTRSDPIEDIAGALVAVEVRVEDAPEWDDWFKIDVHFEVHRDDGDISIDREMPNVARLAADGLTTLAGEEEITVDDCARLCVTARAKDGQVFTLQLQIPTLMTIEPKDGFVQRIRYGVNEAQARPMSVFRAINKAFFRSHAEKSRSTSPVLVKGEDEDEDGDEDEGPDPTEVAGDEEEVGYTFKWKRPSRSVDHALDLRIDDGDRPWFWLEIRLIRGSHQMWSVAETRGRVRENMTANQRIRAVVEPDRYIRVWTEDKDKPGKLNHCGFIAWFGPMPDDQVLDLCRDGIVWNGVDADALPDATVRIAVESKKGNTAVMSLFT